MLKFTESLEMYVEVEANVGEKLAKSELQCYYCKCTTRAITTTLLLYEIQQILCRTTTK